MYSGAEAGLPWTVSLLLESDLYKYSQALEGGWSPIPLDIILTEADLYLLWRLPHLTCLMDGEMILSWLISQDVFETKDEIEEVNRKLLEKLLDENEFVAVYFCKPILYRGILFTIFIIFKTRTTALSATRWSPAWRRSTTRRTPWTSPS